MQLLLKILRRKANSLDPDQTAPSGAVGSGSKLFAYAILAASLVYVCFIQVFMLLSAIFQSYRNNVWM